MIRALQVVAIVAGGLTTFIGTWGLVELGEASTPELREMQMWICLALLAGGIGVMATTVAGMLRQRGM